MSLPSLTIVGLARNVSGALQPSLEAIVRICGASENPRSIIVTNDNKDGTDRVLDDWARLHRFARIVHCDGVASRYPHRIERIAHLRNLALAEARKTEPLPELLIVMDLDGLNSGMEPEAIARSIGRAPQPWTGIFPNQDGPYYDLYALRKRGWITDRFWRVVARPRESGWLARTLERLCQRRRRRRVRRMTRSRQYMIPEDSGFISVDSAFGGLGIYRMAALDGLYYASRDADGEVVCEHVTLNRQIRARHGLLYIDAALRNRCPEDHFARDKALSGLPFPAKLRV